MVAGLLDKESEKERGEEMGFVVRGTEGKRREGREEGRKKVSVCEKGGWGMGGE